MELKATHRGSIAFGAFDIPCYVLSNGMRVLSQPEVDSIITGWEGERERASKSADRAVIAFHDGPSVVYAVPATDLLDLCNSYAMAGQLRQLEPHQTEMAGWAETFIAACAETDIDDLIDEAAGRK